MFIFPDAANIFSKNINVSHENIQITEVKNESVEFNFAEKITKMADNNSRQDKVASESKKNNLFFLISIICLNEYTKQ